jgi:hypothetical protein
VRRSRTRIVLYVRALLRATLMASRVGR